MATKICSKCKQSKPLSEFYRDKQKRDKLTSSCKQCAEVMGKIYRDKVQEDNTLRQIRNNYHRQYRRLNIRKQREYYKLKQREYNKTPKGKYYNKRSIAKRLGIKFDISRQEFVDWFNRQKPLGCYYCNADLEFIEQGNKTMGGITIDRKNNDNGYTLENICLSCRRCNTIKGNWFNEQQMLEIAKKYLRRG